jgi:hypothetical protein
VENQGADWTLIVRRRVLDVDLLGARQEPRLVTWKSPRRYRYFTDRVCPRVVDAARNSVDSSH